jgi:hypothetical protein
MDLEGPWTVTFDPRWGGPGPVTFEQLVSWPDREEPGIKYYSGTATYRVRFARPSSAGPDESIALNLGDVRELAEVRLNGQPLAVLWTPPFRVEVGAALRDGENTLEIDVVNFWPNRIIGDDALGVSQRVTKTNIRKLTRATPLMPAGLMGPVRWERRQAR